MRLETKLRLDSLISRPRTAASTSSLASKKGLLTDPPHVQTASQSCITSDKATFFPESRDCLLAGTEADAGQQVTPVVSNSSSSMV